MSKLPFNKTEESGLSNGDRVGERSELSNEDPSRRIQGALTPSHPAHSPTPSPSVKPMSWAQAAVLTGEEKWWDFLQPPDDAALRHTDDSSVNFELGQKEPLKQRQKRASLPAFRQIEGAVLLCGKCGGTLPSDLNVCVYCGGLPRYRTPPRSRLLIIEAVPDPDVRQRLIEILDRGTPLLPRESIEATLNEPPAVFFGTMSDELAEAIVLRLQRLGVRATFCASWNPEASWIREISESVRRSPREIGIWATSAAASAMAIVFWSMWFIPVAAAVFAGLTWRQSRWYSRHYRFRTAALLAEINGFRPETVAAIQRVFSALEDEEVESTLTLCFMELYAIFRQLDSAPDTQQRLFAPLRSSTEDLATVITQCGERYVQVSDLLYDRHGNSMIDLLKSDLEKLNTTSTSEQVSEFAAREVQQKRHQLESLMRLSASRRRLNDKLRAMAVSLESFRARLVALSLSPFDYDISTMESSQTLMQDVLHELDQELEVVEDTWRALV